MMQVLKHRGQVISVPSLVFGGPAWRNAWKKAADTMSGWDLDVPYAAPRRGRSPVLVDAVGYRNGRPQWLVVFADTPFDLLRFALVRAAREGDTALPRLVLRADAFRGPLPREAGEERRSRRPYVRHLLDGDLAAAAGDGLMVAAHHNRDLWTRWSRDPGKWYPAYDEPYTGLAAAFAAARKKGT